MQHFRLMFSHPKEDAVAGIVVFLVAGGVVGRQGSGAPAASSSGFARPGGRQGSGSAGERPATKDGPKTTTFSETGAEAARMPTGSSHHLSSLALMFIHLRTNSVLPQIIVQQPGKEVAPRRRRFEKASSWQLGE